MTNIETIDMANRSELARILARGKWCDGCVLTLCGTEGCADHIETWMGMECEGEENPPADNEPQQEAPAERNPDKTMINYVTTDNVNHPSHYNHGKIEVIDFIEDKELGFHLGNAVKYISRAGRKDANKTIEDLRKAEWYLNRQIERLERGGGKMNKSEKNGAFKAYMHIRDWCHFLGFPCGNCPFSVPPYDDDEGRFAEGVEVCSLDDIIVDGDKFKGYKLPKKKIDELADRGWK